MRIELIVLLFKRKLTHFGHKAKVCVRGSALADLVRTVSRRGLILGEGVGFTPTTRPNNIGCFKN